MLAATGTHGRFQVEPTGNGFDPAALRSTNRQTTKKCLSSSTPKQRGLTPLIFFLSLDQLLYGLAAEDADAAKIAQLHLFAGLSVGQAGEAMGQSRASAYWNWKSARAWLRTALEK